MKSYIQNLFHLGLKQALETVNDYNPLMKDFPLNDLLSATELDKIRQALVAIFTHLRKIRNTKYPIQRALRLVEAISRDLSSQLLKVLGTRKLMHVAYEEFEKVCSWFCETGCCVFALDSDFQEAFNLGAKVPVLKLFSGNGCML